MKVYQLPLLFIALSTLISCRETEVHDPVNTYTLVFVDKSASTSKYDELQKTKHMKVLDELPNNLKSPGDYVGLFYIDAGTKDGQDKLTDNIIDFETGITEEDGDQTIKRRQDEYNQQLTETRQQIRDQLKAHLNASNDKARQNNTDLWDLLYVINREAEKADQNDKIEVVIFSDMVESVKGNGRRDFHTNPLTSIPQAEKFAAEDFERIKGQLIITQIPNADRIRARLFFPNVAEGKAFIERYWEVMFHKFGIDVKS